GGEVGRCFAQERVDARVLVEAPDEKSALARLLAHAREEVLEERRLAGPSDRDERDDANLRRGRDEPLAQFPDDRSPPHEVARTRERVNALRPPLASCGSRRCASREERVLCQA